MGVTRRLLWVGMALACLSCSTDPTGAKTSIQVLDNSFSPATLTVAPGTTVSWVWNGRVEHNVVFLNDGIASEVQITGQFDHTFPVAGTFAFRCTLHLGMEGSIIVQ